MYDYQFNLFATYAMPILFILAAVAMLSCAAKSRLAFVVGGLGCLLGLIVPEPNMISDYPDAEAAYVGGLRDTGRHMRYYGIVGAALGYGLVIGVSWLKHRPKLQFSIRTALLVTAASGFVIGSFCLFT